MTVSSRHPRAFVRSIVVIAGCLVMLLASAAQVSAAAGASNGSSSHAQLRCAFALEAYADILAESMYDLGDVCGASEDVASSSACADSSAQFDSILAGSGYAVAERGGLACVLDDSEVADAPAESAEPIAQVGLTPR